MRIPKLILGFCALFTTALTAQNGDQILDGIGETGLIARYTFKSNADDWSRNNLHGNIKGAGYRFATDSLFSTVLSLPEEAESYVIIPGESVSGEESLSISAWIYPRSTGEKQVFFDFGKNSQSRLLVTLTGSGEKTTILAQVQTPAKTYELSSEALAINSWHHLALVINLPSKSLNMFINGKIAKEVQKVELSLADLFDMETGKENKLLIGKSQSPDNKPLNAALHDFRLYRIPLNEWQIARIYGIALNKEEPIVRRRRTEANRELPVFSPTTPQLYNAFLTAVPDIEVETVTGQLPRLPRYLKGVYEKGIEGPDVRVIWPSPTDNSQVLTPGTYEVTGKVSGTDLQPKALVTVKTAEKQNGPQRKVEAFQLDRVTLNTDCHGRNTKFIENRDKFFNGLGATNPDNFLYMFRNAFGQQQPEGAEPLGVWDSQQTKLRGHATGHYLTALAQAYAGSAYNKDLQANFAQKMDYMVDVLYELAQLSGTPQSPGGTCVTDPCQVPPAEGKASYDSDLSEGGIRTDYWNWGKGFISAYPPDQFILLEQGATYGGSNSQVWAPYYTLHKILVGLMDIYEICGNKKALDVVTGMGDWVHARLSNLPKETLINMWSRYIAGEFGGMNEAMARLSRLTGEKSYLETARLFDNINMFYGNPEHSHGLAKNVNSFRGFHANQHIPQIVGALEIYRDSQAPEYFCIADNFWTMVTGDFMYSIGGVAGARNPNNAECFTAQPASLYENGFAAGGQNETCATYNMLKLTSGLFMFDQRAELMDYYERGLYNHILASVAEHSPANTYHVPLRPGSVKQFGNPHMNGFTCCNGTAIESSTKLQNSIYFKSTDNKTLYVNLYVASTLQWKERKITITQSTAYPNEDQTKLIVQGKGKFELKVRVPHWAKKGFFVKINGKEIEVDAQPGTYLSLNRKWKKGDVVELRMPFSFYLEPVMDQQNIASLFYGPVLLAAQEEEARTDWRKITLDAKDIGKSITGDPSSLEFKIGDVLFKPFYNTYGRHSVYLDVSLK